MKDIKDVKIEIRMTPEEKANLKAYAANHNTTISELVRLSLNKVLYQEEQQ